MKWNQEIVLYDLSILSVWQQLQNSPKRSEDLRLTNVPFFPIKMENSKTDINWSLQPEVIRPAQTIPAKFKTKDRIWYSMEKETKKITSYLLELPEMDCCHPQMSLNMWFSLFVRFRRSGWDQQLPFEKLPHLF